MNNEESDSDDSWITEFKDKQKCSINLLNPKVIDFSKNCQQIKDVSYIVS